jgi:hypothetical protein
MITGVQAKLLVAIDENGNIGLDENQAELMGLIENEFNWKLVRERDGLTNQSKEIIWLEFDEEGKFKADHKEPAVGRALLMSPFNDFFTWMTTDVTEIVEQREDYIKFNTRNSVYELFRITPNE